MKSKSLAICTITLLLCATAFAQNAPYNPYQSIGKEAEVLTLSEGQYEEFFDRDTIAIIGSAILNTKTMRVIGLVEYDTLYSEATLEPEVVSRWLSTDPLARKYPNMSPYNFTLNNPILFVDPDGRDARISVKENKDGGGVITISTSAHIYGRNAESHKEFAEERWSQLNRESNYVDKQGNTWKVVFDVEFKVTKEIADLDPDRKGVGYDAAKDIAGVEKGDNFICSDCLPPRGALEVSYKGGSITIAPSVGGILHGLFHNIGFDDYYSLEGDIMARLLPKQIDQRHFENAAKTILGEMKRLVDYPTEFKENEQGEKTQVFRGEPLDKNTYTEDK